MKISQKKLDIWYARFGITNSDMVYRGVDKSVFTRIKKHKDLNPATAGKVAEALGVDITDILEEEGQGARVEFEKIVALAKAGEPMPRYSRAMDQLIYGGILRAVVDCKLKRITISEAAECHRNLEKQYRELDAVYALAEDRNRICVALGGYSLRAKTEGNELAVEMLDKIARG